MASIESIFSEFIQKIKEPDWLIQLRTSNFEIFKKLNKPTTNLEQWRKLSLSNFDALDYLGQFTNSSNLVDIQCKYAQSYTFAQLTESLINELQTANQGLQKKYKDSYFAMMALCFFQTGSFIELQKECKDLKLVHSVGNNKSFIDFTYIKLSAHANIHIYHKLENCPNDLHLVNTMLFTELLEGASLEYTEIEAFNSDTFHFCTNYSKLSQDSTQKVYYFNWNGYKGKTFYDVDLDGENSNYSFGGFAILSKREVQDLEVSTYHHKSHTESNLAYKTVVKDKAHHIFTGNLHIDRGLKQVSASQLNNNLLLSKTARSESIPKLEVYAEDVKCSHGATMGEINFEQLFFLMSRGVPETDAKMLIIEGFLAEVVDKIQSEKSKEELMQFIESKLG